VPAASLSHRGPSRILGGCRPREPSREARSRADSGAPAPACGGWSRGVRNRADFAAHEQLDAPRCHRALRGRLACFRFTAL